MFKGSSVYQHAEDSCGVATRLRAGDFTVDPSSGVALRPLSWTGSTTGMKLARRTRVLSRQPVQPEMLPGPLRPFALRCRGRMMTSSEAQAAGLRFFVTGDGHMRWLAIPFLAVAVSGCSVMGSSRPSPSPTARVVARGPTPKPAATAVRVDPGYAAFLHTICRAFTTGDAATVINSLPYYQYNSGLRYGMLGDGEGQTGDPGLLHAWMAGGGVRCRYFTPSDGAHGTVLTSGWKAPAAWSLLEIDSFSGKWKINDFTFGDRNSLYGVMHTAVPILPYGA